MAALAFAVIGEDNSPLYLKDFELSGSKDIISERDFFCPEKINGGGNTVSSSQSECSSKYQFVVHSVLDRFDQLAGYPPGYAWRKPGVKPGKDSMFVGLLCPVEDMRVYGFSTTTQVKFILLVEDEATPDQQTNIDEDIKALMIRIHALYIDDIMNPFKDLSQTIPSKQFQAGVQRHILNFNQSGGMI